MASICPAYFDCLDEEQLLKEAIKLTTLKDADGNDYINFCYIDRGDCDSYEPAFDCLNDDVTLNEIIKLVIVEDECGRPAWNIMGNICEACIAYAEEEEIR